METIEETETQDTEQHDGAFNADIYREHHNAEPNIDQHLANIEAARAAAPAIRAKLQEERFALGARYTSALSAIDAKLAQVDRMLGVTTAPAQAPKRRGRPPLNADQQPSDTAPKKRGWQKGRPRGPCAPKA